MGVRATFVWVNASVTGVSDSRAVQAQAIIRRVLEPWTGSSEVTIVAHRLSTGAWTLMAFDGADRDAQGWARGPRRGATGAADRITRMKLLVFPEARRQQVEAVVRETLGESGATD